MPWGTIEISNRASNRVKGDAPEQSHQQPNRTLRRLVGVPFNTGSEHQWELQESLIVFARPFPVWTQRGEDSLKWRGLWTPKKPQAWTAFQRKEECPGRWSQEPVRNYSLAWTINQERTHICPDEFQNCYRSVPLVWLSFSSAWLSPSLWCLRLYTGFVQQTDDLFLQSIGHEGEKNKTKQNKTLELLHKTKREIEGKKNLETSGSGNTAQQNIVFSKRNSRGEGVAEIWAARVK